jgi:hypothetical protein
MCESMDFASDNHQGATAVTLDSLIATLANPDGVEREKARQRLVSIGRLAVPALIEALQSPSARVRWETARALGQIRDSRAAPALVDALEDEKFAVRWLAAKGLIALGREALIPLLHCVEIASDSVWMREGAHHVLHTLIRDGVADEALPVLEALEDIEPVIEAPVAAYHVLRVLRETAKQEQDGQHPTA